MRYQKSETNHEKFRWFLPEKFFFESSDFEDQGCLITKYNSLPRIVSKAKKCRTRLAETIQISLIYLCLHLASMKKLNSEQYVSVLEHLKCIEKVTWSGSNNQFRNSKFGIYNNFWTIRTSFTSHVFFCLIVFFFVKINLIGLKKILMNHSGLVVGSGEQDQYRRVLYFSSKIEINDISGCVFVFQWKCSWSPPISFFTAWNPQNFKTSLLYTFIGR